MGVVFMGHSFELRPCTKRKRVCFSRTGHLEKVRFHERTITAAPLPCLRFAVMADSAGCTGRNPSLTTQSIDRRCCFGLRDGDGVVQPSRRYHQGETLSGQERHRRRPSADVQFCGTKPIKVALSDGWGGNYWRHITRAEFEDEASKCKNITETRYTDGEFKPEKQIADIQGLIAQKFDVIVAFLDGGPAIWKATREATAAGVAVVPYDTGDNFPGTIGKDYVDRVTESQSQVGEQFADWLAKTLNGKGTVIMLGGTPGNPMTAAQVVGGSRPSPSIRASRCSKRNRCRPTGIRRWRSRRRRRSLPSIRRSTASTARPPARSAPSSRPASRSRPMSDNRSWI